jgi:prepilin-type N-terminal cleavage/methylation domain-containing protein
MGETYKMKNIIKKSLRNNQGFSMVEVMIASVIFLIGMISIIEGFNFGLKMTQSNARRSNAMQLAAQRMEEVMSDYFLHIRPENYPTDYPVLAAAKSYEGQDLIATRKVTILDYITYKEVKVEISWNEIYAGESRRITVDVSTIVSKD